MAERMESEESRQEKQRIRQELDQLAPLERISRIPDPSTKENNLSEQPDDKSARELEKLELENLQLDNDGKRQTIEDRRKLSRWLYYLLCGWTISVLAMVFLQGISATKIKINTTGVPIIEKVTFQPGFKSTALPFQSFSRRLS